MENSQPLTVYIPDLFADISPVNVLHKEQDTSARAAHDRAQSSIRNLHVLCRSDFTPLANKPILRITADDCYKLYVNGTFVTQGPAQSTPDAYYYNEIDLTPYLVPGTNHLAVHLYYQGLVNRALNSGDDRCMLATSLVYAHSNVPCTSDLTATDLTPAGLLPSSVSSLTTAIPLTWYCTVSEAFSGGVTGYDTQYLENFDARKWDYDFATAPIDRAGYRIMPIRQDHGYTFIKQPTKQLDIYPVAPASIELRDSSALSPDRYLFVDFGREITGMLRIRAHGPAGSVITMLCGEETEQVSEAASGSSSAPVSSSPLPRVRFNCRCNCTYRETFTLSGRDEDVYENYDYKAFRYLEIHAGSEITVDEVGALMRHYPFDDRLVNYKGEDPVLSDIFDLCKYTIKLGTQEHFVDCPSREKGQYLGDCVITAKAHLLLTHDNTMLRSCIDRFARTASVCPGLMAVAPGSLMQEIADYSLLFSELLLTDYDFSHDADYLRKLYPAALGVLRYFEKFEGPDGLIYNVGDKWNLVDWPENLRDGYDFPLTRPVVGEGAHNVINALYVGAVGNLCAIEDILALPHTYDLKKKKASFTEAFLDPAAGLFRDSLTSSHISLHSNIFPLYFGLCPDNADTIAAYIASRGLVCGTYMSYFALEGLVRSGHRDLAIALIKNDSEHGWLNMLREGATTAFEAWGKDQKWNTSLCHPWSCAPVIILLTLS